MNWADAYERISGVLKEEREAHARSVTRVAELSGELAEATAREVSLAEAANQLSRELAEANNRWHSACDVGRRLEARNAQLLNELEEAHTLRPLQTCTPAERKVLDAVAYLSADHLRGVIEGTTEEELTYPEVVAGVAFCKAVLALLEGK